MREGKRLRTAHLDVRVVVSPREHGRVGFIVAKQGRTAVERNRVKRRLRELVRRELLRPLRRLRPGATADVVVRAKPEAYDASLETLRSEIAGLGERIDVLVGARVVTGRDTPTTDGS